MAYLKRFDSNEKVKFNNSQNTFLTGCCGSGIGNTLYIKLSQDLEENKEDGFFLLSDNNAYQLKTLEKYKNVNFILLDRAYFTINPFDVYVGDDDNLNDVINQKAEFLQAFLSKEIGFTDIYNYTEELFEALYTIYSDYFEWIDYNEMNIDITGTPVFLDFIHAFYDKLKVLHPDVANNFVKMMNESEYGKKIGFINRTSIEFNPDTLYIFGYQEGGLNLLEYDYITNVVCKRYEDEHMKYTKVYIENPVAFDDMRYIVKNQDYNKCIVTYKLIDFNSFEILPKISKNLYILSCNKKTRRQICKIYNLDEEYVEKMLSGHYIATGLYINLETIEYESIEIGKLFEFK